MKFRKNTILYLFLLFPFFPLGCTEEEEYLPGLTGDAVGYVYLFDEFGNLLDDHSHVRITAIGTRKQYDTYTDSKGRFELKGLPTGTYELHFEKAGFGRLKQFGVKHLGGKPTLFANYFLFKMPATTITNLTIENDTVYGEFLFIFQEQPYSLFLRIYFSTVPGFSRESTQYIMDRELRQYDGRYLRSINLEHAPFSPGEEVFIMASIYTRRTSVKLDLGFSMTISGIDTYFDYELNQTIYPNLSNVSDHFSFIFPE